eukprot:6898380-Alexandrium_andersonii.AAC.1
MDSRTEASAFGKHVAARGLHEDKIPIALTPSPLRIVSDAARQKAARAAGAVSATRCGPKPLWPPERGG